MNMNENFSEAMYDIISERINAQPQFIDNKHVIFINDNSEQICKFYGMKKVVVRNTFVMSKISYKNIYEITYFINRYK